MHNKCIKLYKINKSLKIIKKVFTSPNENVTVRTSQGTGGLATAAKFGKAAANASSAFSAKCLFDSVSATV